VDGLKDSNKMKKQIINLIQEKQKVARLRKDSVISEFLFLDNTMEDKLEEYNEIEISDRSIILSSECSIQTDSQ